METDHQALTYLNKSKSYMVRDWLHYFLGYDFMVEYKKGIEHVLPDVLSWLIMLPEDGSMVGGLSDLEIDDAIQEGLWNQVQGMIVKLTGKSEPPDDQKKEVIKKIHTESHISPIGLCILAF